MSKIATDKWSERVALRAGTAPSLHNSQPWQFSTEYGLLSLHGVPDRALCVSDPAARALYISCGAALFNVRLCMRVAGMTPQVRLLPHPEYPFDVLALIRNCDGPPPSAAERGLYDAIPRRHTNRAPFSDRLIPHRVWRRLCEAASYAGGALHLPDRAQATDLLAAAAEAGRQLARHDAHQAELRQWIATGSDHGIPLGALPSRPDLVPAPVRVDDFTAAAPAAPLAHASYERFPQLAVLTTKDDEPEDWMAAGQALQRVLLTATASSLSASFLYHPIEMRDMGQYDPALWPGPPNTQMIIRLGYATAPSVPVPRLPPDALLRPGFGLRVA